MPQLPPLLRRTLQRHWPLLVVVAPCLLIALCGNAADTLLRYERAAILHGQYWRLLTGNFVHLGVGHLLEDMLGAVLLWLLFEDVLPEWCMPLTIVGGSVGVGLGLLIGNPEVEWYVGISGALDTLWAVGAMALLRKQDRFGWLLAGFLIAKLCYEQFFGPMPLSAVTTGGDVIVDAHLYGAFTGGLLGCGWALYDRRRIMRGPAQSGLKP